MCLDSVSSAEEVYCQERASFVVAELAAEYSFKVLLQRSAAMEKLVPLLASPDPDIQVQCSLATSSGPLCCPSLLYTADSYHNFILGH